MAPKPAAGKVKDQPTLKPKIEETKNGGNTSDAYSYDVITLLFVCIILVMLFFWYRWHVERSNKKQTEKIKELKRYNRKLEYEMKDMQRILREYEDESASTSPSKMVRILDKKFDDLLEEMESIKYGKIKQQLKGKSTSEIRNMLMQTTEETYELQQKLEDMKKSIVSPEVQQILQEYKESDSSPQSVISVLLKELDRRKSNNLQLHKENRELNEQLNCLTIKTNTHEKSIADLKDQISCHEKYKEINHLLQQMLDEGQSENLALQHINEEKCNMISNLRCELQQKEERLERLNCDLQRERESQEQMRHKCHSIIESKNKLIQNSLRHLEADDKLLGCLAGETTTSNIEEVRKILSEKLHEVQKFYRQMKLLAVTTDCPMEADLVQSYNHYDKCSLWESGEDVSNQHQKCKTKKTSSVCRHLLSESRSEYFLYDSSCETQKLRSKETDEGIPLYLCKSDESRRKEMLLKAVYDESDKCTDRRTFLETKKKLYSCF